MQVTQYGNSGKKFSHEKCQFSETIQLLYISNLSYDER